MTTDIRFILGPDLWNALHHSLLRLKILHDSHLIKYGDDVAAPVAARMVEQTHNGNGDAASQEMDD